ncbi:MAG: hypothetical protein WC570_00660 [Patescibacteria group bacterium]
MSLSLLEQKELAPENGLDNLSKENFYFEKNTKPVDIALISFLDHNHQMNPEEVLRNVRINCKNIKNLSPSDNRKIDGYFLPSDPTLYQSTNHEFVDFITQSIADASIDAHQAENFIFYDQEGCKVREYFYQELEKKIDRKNKFRKSTAIYHFARVGNNLSVDAKVSQPDGIIFVCIDPNLIEQSLTKIVKSYGFKKYQVVGLPGSAYSMVRPETKEILTDYIKNYPLARAVFCSHGPSPDQKQDEPCYNCGGYQLFEHITGIEAYQQAKRDLQQVKSELKKNNITKVDTVINMAQYMGQGSAADSKLYKATFEIVA